MSFSNDNWIDPDEALRMVEGLSGSHHGTDYVMRLEKNDGTVVEGESDRLWDAVAGRRMAVEGHYFNSWAEAASGSGSRRRTTHTNLVVVRRCDAATAKIASLYNNQEEGMRMMLSYFKAGGDNSIDSQPTLQLKLEGARISALVLLTNGSPNVPREVIFFAYRALQIESAAQLSDGRSGPISSCIMR